MAIYADFGGRTYQSMVDPNHPAILRQPVSVDAEIARHVRADSAVDGLIKKTIVCPETGRKTYEFSNAGARKDWMLPFMGQSHEMLRICKEHQTPAQNARFEESLRATAEGLRTGTLVLPEI